MMDTNSQRPGPAAPFTAMAAAMGGMGLFAALQGLGALTLPFDTARDHYARSVQAGLLPKSILASRDFERALAALEQLTRARWPDTSSGASPSSFALLGADIACARRRRTTSVQRPLSRSWRWRNCTA